MRMIFTILMLAMDLGLWAQSPTPPTYYIPSAGATYNSLGYSDIAGQTFYVGTIGAVNLGGNTFTLTYSALPPANTQWNVIMDASQLTLTAKSQVNIFGETPLAKFPNTTVFYINFSVVWDNGVPAKKTSYFSSLAQIDSFTHNVNFTDTLFSSGTLRYKPNSGGPNSGNVLAAGDANGNVVWSCTPWCVTGNAGLTNANFWGNTDTVPLRARTNNQPALLVDLNLLNTFFGYQAGKGNTTGTDNVAVGHQALLVNATGVGNVAVGIDAMTALTSTSNNTAIGTSALGNHISGGFNTGIGASSLSVSTTGSNNTAIGYNANIASASTTHALALGDNAVAGSGQVALGPHQYIFSMVGHTSAIGYVLTDTSGTGDYVPRAGNGTTGTTFTPVTGDSIAITTGKNTVNPAGTLANLTFILPASPTPWTTYNFSFQQIISALHISTRLSGGTVSAFIPTVLSTAGQIFGIYWDPNLSKWILEHN